MSHRTCFVRKDTIEVLAVESAADSDECTIEFFNRTGKSSAHMNMPHQYVVDKLAEQLADKQLEFIKMGYGPKIQTEKTCMGLNLDAFNKN